MIVSCLPEVAFKRGLKGHIKNQIYIFIYILTQNNFLQMSLCSPFVIISVVAAVVSLYQ